MEINMSVNSIISKLSNNGTRKVYYSTFNCPLGKLIAAADDDYLYIVSFEDSKNIGNSFKKLSAELKCKFIEEKNILLKKFEEELSYYFDGKLKKFTVPVKTLGSEFQNAVWDKLIEIPYGSTKTYAELAKDLGRSSSHSRAVGAACGANHLVIVVPCHRLVASGSMGGFSCGLDRKDKLLQLEKMF